MLAIYDVNVMLFVSMCNYSTPFVGVSGKGQGPQCRSTSGSLSSRPWACSWKKW